MKPDLLLAIDQGTTGTTSLVMDTTGATLGRASVEFRQHFPSPGLVEHDADEIWASVLEAVAGALRAVHGASPAARLILISGSSEGLPDMPGGVTAAWVRKPFEVGEILRALAPA